MFILDHDNKNEIRGQWYKYTYLINGHETYVYMTEDRQFKAYFADVLHKNKLYGGGRYTYSLPEGGVKKVAMTMSEIVSDQNAKVKALLNFEHWDYIQ